MAISKQDREAYEQGVEDRKTLDIGFFELISGAVIATSLAKAPAAFREETYSGSQREAYRRGLHGQQLDED